MGIFSLRKKSKKLNIETEKTRQLHGAGIMALSDRTLRVQARL